MSAGRCLHRPPLDEQEVHDRLARIRPHRPRRLQHARRDLEQDLLDEARRAGYSAMLLDTLDDMEAARELYASLGFVEIPPYYFNPIPGAHYLKAELK